MRITALGRTLSLFEGDVRMSVTRAKARETYSHLDLTQDPERSFRRMRNLRNVYLQGSYVAEGVDLYPLYAIGAGYELEGEDETAKEKVREFFNRINFFDVTWQMMVDAEVVRDGIAEIVYGKGSMAKTPVNVIPRPAECFNFDTTVTGDIRSYDQVYDNRGNTIAPIKLEPKQILHYQYQSRPDSPYGISLIERVIHEIKRDTRVSEAVTEGICLHGTPKWHIAVNGEQPDSIPLSDAEYTAVEQQFDKFSAKDQFVTEGDIKIKALDVTGIQNVQQYSDVTLTRVVSGMGVPGELLGLRQGTTDATATVRVQAFYKKIKSIQRDIEQMWNNHIIDLIVGRPGVVKLVLADTDPADFLQMAQGMAALRTGMDPDAVCPADWCREQLGIPPDEGDRDIRAPPQTPDEIAAFLDAQVAGE